MKQFVIVLAMTLACVTATHAQSYPNRPIRFIVPFAPGGDTDVVGRALAQKLGESIGESVVVDNKGGGNGILGTELAAKSPADGYTILVGATGFVINPSLYRNLPYDALRDFVPVSLIATAPHVLVVHPSVPVKSVKDLISLARTHPGQLSFSSGGNGASSHLSGAMFNVMAQTRMLHVPYRGAGPAAIAVVSGEVSSAFLGVLAALPHVKSGRLRGIAVTGIKRSPAAPELPTIAEAGVPEFESGGWFGILAPARTPGGIIARLNAELVKIAHRPDVRAKFVSEGSDVVGSTPEHFAEYIRQQLSRWARIIKEADIRVE